MDILNGAKNQQFKTIKEKVLSKIKSGEVKMSPKALFALKTTLIVFGAVLAALFIVFLASFIIFAMRASGTLFLPAFGFFGMRTFFTSLPWLLILIAVISIVVLEVLAKRFTFVYRRPIFYSVLAIIILVLCGGVFIERTRLHSNLFWRAREGRLPIMGNFYRNPNIMPPRNVYEGVVSEMTEKGFRIKNADNQIFNIVVASDTRFPLEEKIKEGDAVVVMGEQKGDTIYAFGVHRIEGEFNIFEHRPRPFTPPPELNDTK